MKRTIISILTCLILLSGYSSSKAITDTKYDAKRKQDILCMMLGYPGYITDIVKDNNDSGKIFLILKSGVKVLYDDKKQKTMEQKLYDGDIEDTLEQIYPLEQAEGLQKENFDPGRVRNYKFLSAIYGGNCSEIEKKLTNADFIHSRLRFNGENEANINLKKVGNQVKPLLSKGSIYSNIFPISGTYNYRYIAGTGNLSPHSFGIAIDLHVDRRDYWKWASKDQGAERIKGYPQELVKAFEDNYFIWGGKWQHFDVMHYEYRPEIIIKAKYFSKELAEGEAWYGSVNVEDAYTKECIDKIEKCLR